MGPLTLIKAVVNLLGEVLPLTRDLSRFNYGVDHFQFGNYTVMAEGKAEKSSERGKAGEGEKGIR
jgi:hypothetical protein